MLFSGLLAVVEIALLVYCVLEVVSTPREAVRGLPKPVWIVLIVLLPLIGGTAWLLAGRPKAVAHVAAPPAQPSRPATPDDDEAFLRGLRERAEQQRRKAEQDRRAAEQRREHDPGSSDAR